MKKDNEREQITLLDYMKSYHHNDEFEGLFYQMDLMMKQVHNKGYYITNFNPKNIILSSFSDKNFFITFSYLDSLSDNYKDEINVNVYNMAFLEVGLLSETLNYLQPAFLKQNFSQFTIFLPESLVNYYRMILVNGGHSYLSDYLQVKNNQEIAKLQQSIDSEGGNNKGRSYVKSTGHYGNNENNDSREVMAFALKDDNNIAAFVTNYVLAFIVLASSLLIPLIAFLLGQK